MHGTATAITPPTSDAIDANELLIELAGDHGSVSALRASILDRAVSGRLLAQGPVGEQQEAGAFAIPAHWRWVRGTEVFSFVTSGSRGWAQYYADKGPIFLRIGNLDYESIELDLREIQRVRPPAGAEGTRTKVEAGDILISITGDTGMVGLVREGLGDAYINQHIALARPASGALPEYIARALTAPAILGAVQRAQRGIKNSLGLEDIRHIALPLPPLAEQKRIVAKVDQLMALCDELEAKQVKKRDVGDRLTKAAVAALTSAETLEEFKVAWERLSKNLDVVVDSSPAVDALRGMVLDLAVRGLLPVAHATGPTGEAIVREAMASGKPGNGGRGKEQDAEATGLPTLPPGWAWARIGNVFEVVGGLQKTPARAPRSNHYPYLRVENVQRGRLVLDRIERFELQEGELDRLRLVRGDLLVVEGNGSEREIGRCAQWGGDIEDCVHQNHLIRCRALGRISPEFTLLFLNSPLGKAEMKSLAVTTSGLYSLSVGKVRSVSVPVPPPDVTKRLLGVMRNLLALCDDLAGRLNHRDHASARLAQALAEFPRATT